MEISGSKSKAEEQGSKCIVTSNKAFLKHTGDWDSRRASGSCRLSWHKVSEGRKRDCTQVKWLPLFSLQSREGRCMPQGYTSAELPDRVRGNKIKQMKKRNYLRNLIALNCISRAEKSQLKASVNQRAKNRSPTN